MLPENIEVDAVFGLPETEKILLNKWKRAVSTNNIDTHIEESIIIKYLTNVVDITHCVIAITFYSYRRIYVCTYKYLIIRLRSLFLRDE